MAFFEVSRPNPNSDRPFMTLNDPEVSQVEIDRLLNRAKIAKKIDNLTPYIHMEACSTNEI